MELTPFIYYRHCNTNMALYTINDSFSVFHNNIVDYTPREVKPTIDHSNLGPVRSRLRNNSFKPFSFPRWHADVQGGNSVLVTSARTATSSASCISLGGS